MKRTRVVVKNKKVAAPEGVELPFYTRRRVLGRLAGKLGFEPRSHDPESCVLPLDDFPALD